MRRTIATALLAAGCSILACAGDEDEVPKGDVGPPPPSGKPLAVYVANNGLGSQGEVDRFDQHYDLEATALPGNNQGVALDHLGNLYQAGDGTTFASVRVFSRIRSRGTIEPFDVDVDREIGGGSAALLVAPKGVELAQRAGFVLVADAGASRIAVFGTAAGGDVAPYATTPLDAPPWDLAYDEAADRLFVARTDGTIAVLDAYVGGGFAGGPDRVILPVDGAGAAAAVSLRGIAYDAAGDRLVVTDVGVDGEPGDGALLVFTGASTAGGATEPHRAYRGPATRLDDPVDVALDGGEARVADKGAGLLLIFTNVFHFQGGDVEPALAAAEDAPESLVLEPAAPAIGPDTSDLDDFTLALDGLLVGASPDADPGIGELARLDPSLAEVASFDAQARVRDVALDRVGDAFASFDDGAGDAGILIVNRLAKDRDGEAPSAARDRRIAGPATRLVHPRGVEVADALGRLLVAETEPPSVLVFSTTAGGDAAPLAAVALPAAPSDLDYDPVDDRLFVALADGRVAVYDVFFTLPPPAAPDRVIRVADGFGGQASVRLLGLVHDALEDVLIVADAGADLDADDGALYVIDNAASADGLVAPAVAIQGRSTSLAEPFDLAFDGRDLFVAERANQLVLRFNDVLVSAGGDLAPSASAARTAPGTLVLVPSDLAPSSGGSIHGEEAP